MILTSKEISVALVTEHIPLSKVCTEIIDKNLERTIKHAIEFVQANHDYREIVVLGLNPHAGESGTIGNEEVIIQQTINRMKDSVPRLVGPISPDTAFLRNRLENTSCYVVMYHDQGLIPLKLLSFGRAANVTMGLPFFRASPDHGTAFELAGKIMRNISSSSMEYAINLAMNFPEKS